MAKNDKIEDKAQEEHSKLLARIAELEAEKAERELNAPPEQRPMIEEMSKIRSIKDKALATGGITYKDIHDHKNIPLYHTNGLHIGKIVGPIHPGNAEDVFNQFRKAGVVLSLDKPSADVIARYKATAGFKKLEEAFLKRRSAKDKSKKQSEIERLTEVIARTQGVDPKSLNRIKEKEEVLK